MIDPKNCELKTVPAAAELRRVPNFNPLQYLRKSVSRKTGEKVLILDLTHKKRWFRLAFPHGRMMLTPLRITDQMALFRASLYSSMDDSQLLAEFTSSKERGEVGSQYIQAAQDEALNQALDNAGFGIQLSDLVETTGGSGCGSEILLSEVETILKRMDCSAQIESTVVSKSVHTTAETPTPVVKAGSVQENRPPANASSPLMDKTTKEKGSETPVQTEAITAAEPVLETVSHIPESSTILEPASSELTPAVQETNSTSDRTDVLPTEAAENMHTETDNILQMLSTIPTPEAKVQAPAPQSAAVVDFPLPTEDQQDEEQPADESRIAEIAFTEDMTVDEIRKLMTVEQAKAQMVTFGTNKGWNLGQVLDRRPSSLRFYALVAKEASNALKAASFLLMEELRQARAG